MALYFNSISISGTRNHSTAASCPLVLLGRDAHILRIAPVHILQDSGGRLADCLFTGSD